MKIDTSTIQTSVDGDLDSIVTLISHFGLYIVGVVIIGTIIKMGVDSKRTGEVNWTPLVIEFIMLALIAAINVSGLSFIGI